MAPDHPGLLNNLGLALEKDDRVADAEPRYRRLKEQVPPAPPRPPEAPFDPD